MQVDIPRPSPRQDGSYDVWVNMGYGDPRAVIHLAASGTLDLRDVRADDCDRLIRAAAQAKEQILRYRAQMAAPHGRAHLYDGTCQLCGKPEDDALHASHLAPPDPADVVEATIYCGATAGDDDGNWRTCEREDGHPGSHRVTLDGGNGGMAWSDWRDVCGQRTGEAPCLGMAECEAAWAALPPDVQAKYATRKDAT